jgi:chloride channel, nucleotide-sensitive, 1A
VILFSNSNNRGLSISYPAIGLHALGSSPSPALSSESTQVVFLQLNLHDADTINSDDDLEILDITLLPLEPSPPNEHAQGEPAPPIAPAKALFEALSNCADLHPDPQSPGSDELVPEPGDGGWITAENMGRFVDADGTFTGVLGPGAGYIHEREDDDESGVNGKSEEEDETKWQRRE